MLAFGTLQQHHVKKEDACKVRGGFCDLEIASRFLIVNRAEVSADIKPIEYTPKPEYEGHFDTYNEENEFGSQCEATHIITPIPPRIIAPPIEIGVG
eukprot:6481542-Amphidinium_carterae.1